MKKKIIILVSVYLLVSVLMLGSYPVSAEIGDVLLDDGWENEIVGAQSGTSGLIEYEGVEDNDSDCWGISNAEYRNTRSFLVESRSSGDSDSPKGYWNLTTSFDYISSFEFWVHTYQTYSDASGDDENVYLRFYDDNDIEVLKLKFDGNNKVRNYEVGTGVDTFGTTTDNEWHRITVTHIDTNQMNFSLYNETNDYVSGEIGSTLTADNWESFSYIYLDGNEGGNGAVSLYFDDFTINQNVDNYNCYELTSASIFVDGVQQLPDVLQGSKVDYMMKVEGDIGTTVFLKIFDSNDHLRYFNNIGEQFVMTTSPDYFNFSVTYSYGWSTGNYTMNINDWLFYPCDGDFSQHWNSTFNVYNPVVIDYDLIYTGIDLFAEFDTIQYPDLRLNDNVPIVYHLPDNLTSTTV